MNTANKLTMLRVVMIPIYLVLWHLDFPYHNYAALAVFILASLTDLLDAISPGTAIRSRISASLWIPWRTRCWS